MGLWVVPHEKANMKRIQSHLGLECEHSIVYLRINAACLILLLVRTFATFMKVAD